MKYDWNELQVFLAVERGGTARAAGARLKCSHSTTLRRLDTFETRLGVKLFNRTPEGFSLTGAGEKILAKAQQIEAEMLEIERVVTGSDLQLKGLIRLTVPPPVAESLLLPVLTSFKNQYPEIEIEVVSTYEYSDLSRRDADIAIRFSDVPDDYLVGRRLPPFRDSIYATPKYIEKHCSESATEKPQWIEWDSHELFRRRISTSKYANHPSSWRFPTLPLQIVAAEQGLGMAFLPCLLGSTNPHLERIPDAELIDSPPGWILTHPDLRRMERVRVFSQHLYDAFCGQKHLFGGE